MFHFAKLFEVEHNGDTHQLVVLQDTYEHNAQPALCCMAATDTQAFRAWIPCKNESDRLLAFASFRQSDANKMIAEMFRQFDKADKSKIGTAYGEVGVARWK